MSSQQDHQLSQLNRHPEAIEQIEQYVSFEVVSSDVQNNPSLLNFGEDADVESLQLHRAQFVVDRAAEVLSLKQRRLDLDAERLSLESRLGVIATQTDFIDARLGGMRTSPEVAVQTKEEYLLEMIGISDRITFFERLADQPAFSYYLGANDKGIPPFSRGTWAEYSDRAEGYLDNCMRLIGRMTNTMLMLEDSGVEISGAIFVEVTNSHELSHVDIVSPTSFFREMFAKKNIGLQALKAFLVAAHLQAEYLEFRK